MNNEEALILIVDDIPRNLQVLGSILSGSGFGVSVASSGQSALDAVQETIPDVILLDIQMPDMDGFEVCERLKSNPTTADIPVIFLTARTEVDDIVRGFDVGAVDYITKPFISQELLARVRTHLRLVRQTKRLQDLNNDKNEFLGIAAHDLRNPLSKIQFIAEKMAYEAQTFTPELINDAAQDILHTVSGMMELISNLLDVNVIEQGKLVVELNPIEVGVIIEHIVRDYEARAAAKKITLQYDHDERLPLIQADEVAVAQIMDNLLSNAIKYSPTRTQVTIRLYTQEQFVRLDVQDQGLGMSDDDQKRLFQKFARLSAKPTGNEHSIGLGLSIVKTLVDKLQARISVESAIGKGTTFSVLFPVAQGTNHGTQS
ncbi:MAG: hybrid sensor histidine kinase/response regulator [Bacteroidota bacterium]|nr:hybrid sensor histidine kinase/response regulator [Candidatus Kapabacteria bacterium]MDW8219517.1 hybrid sensor histidine kinase/response regulator [Bacteroidota bacterium]